MNQPPAQKPKRHPILPLLLFLSPFFILHSSFFPLLFPLPASAQTTPDRKAGGYDRVTEFYQYALPIFRQASDLAEADRLMQQGDQQLDTSQYRAALQSFQQALEIYQTIGDQNGKPSH